MTVQRMIRQLMGSALAAGVAVACGGSATQPVTACSSAQSIPVTLAVGAYTSVNPGSSVGCVGFPANGSSTDSAEYLIVAAAKIVLHRVVCGQTGRRDIVVVDTIDDELLGAVIVRLETDAQFVAHDAPNVSSNRSHIAAQDLRSVGA